MGENVYPIQDYNGNWIELQFSEMDDDYACLCTFPNNDMGHLDADRVRSLALFGAAVRLVFDSGLEHGFLPQAVPEWIRKEIDRVLDWKGRQDDALCRRDT